MRRRRQQGKAVFDLIEEAVHSLRTAPAATLAVYYLGTIPFVLGLLYFWTDMSRSPFAGQELAESAFGMAALFVWMKFWQGIFAARLRAQVAAESMPRWNFVRSVNVFLTQGILQPWGLLLVAVLAGTATVSVFLAIILALPISWLLTFFQNVTALADSRPACGKRVLSKAWAFWLLWPRQNLVVFLLVGAFGFYVFLNWTVAGLLMPFLIKMLFGIESVFTRSPFSMFNTTFFAGMASLTYLCVDPILKAVYVLRCFYGESLASGEDLRAELNSIASEHRPPTRRVEVTKRFHAASETGTPMAILIALLLFCGSPVRAAGTSATAPPARPAQTSPSITPANLNKAINQTIHQDKYTWRMPRQKTVQSGAQEGVVARFLDKIDATLQKWAHAVVNWIGKWLRKLFPHPQVRSGSASSGPAFVEFLRVMVYALVAVVVVAVAVLLYRAWQGRQRRTVVASQPVRLMPDIEDESVGADQMPEDGWTKLARELLDRGELRLALRAFYFASLSHLAARNLISIARFKSNRDYERELRRRGHSFPELLLTFGDNLLSFERVWYGLHEVNRELVDRFASNVERIKAAG